MKNIFLKTIGGTALTILMMVMFALVPVSAQDNDNNQKNDEQTQEDSFGTNRRQRLVGTWDVQVTLRNCQTGAPIRTFASIGTFMYRGTALDSTSGIPQALKTPGQGVWSHVGVA